MCTLNGENILCVIESDGCNPNKLLTDKATELGLEYSEFYKLRDIKFSVVNVYDGFGDIFIKELK